MPENTPLPRRMIRLAELPERRATEIELVPSADERAAVARDLDIPGVRKLRFLARLIPEGRDGWRLEGEIGATVVQDCVATLEPVVTRIDETVTRRYLADWREPEGVEVEMPEDDTLEPLPAALDLAQVMIEALALALPDYPRADGAAPADASAIPPGAAPIRDEEVKPFAGLAALRDKLGGGDGKADDGTPGDDADNDTGDGRA
ncbi:YceD family protein [Limimaricola pyoseonensis]|uniref:Uncharacterized metal-binding protein YceD, DUF177 family n=1 Tax=Limimaricola pyoseonensis TaxID=521013 RepID=A0A1G7ARB0_9RHOB|nr:DUF177 domain-containing protein [Limimaricola pyoseonensis]SDE17343.1 Uncharacterized metal-binding protein YceD, DUF177 family [Limimaricola pyoseonensis]